jgi:hypothetical protein
VGPRAGLDEVDKRKFLILLGLELRPLGRPVAIPTMLSHLLNKNSVHNDIKNEMQSQQMLSVFFCSHNLRFEHTRSTHETQILDVSAKHVLQQELRCEVQRN